MSGPIVTAARLARVALTAVLLLGVAVRAAAGDEDPGTGSSGYPITLPAAEPEPEPEPDLGASADSGDLDADGEESLDGLELDDIGDPPGDTRGPPPAPARVEPQARPHPQIMPPLRLEFRTPFRQGLGPGLATSTGMQLARTRIVTFDVALSFVSGRQLTTPGPFRSVFGLELSTFAMAEIGRWMAIGPIGGATYEWYVQQRQLIASVWTPFFGARLDTALLRARWFAIVVSGRATVDLSQTQLVLETQQVVVRSPYEGQVGLRFDFGRGRIPGQGRARTEAAR